MQELLLTWLKKYLKNYEQTKRKDFKLLIFYNYKMADIKQKSAGIKDDWRLWCLLFLDYFFYY